MTQINREPNASPQPVSNDGERGTTRSPMKEGPHQQDLAFYYGVPAFFSEDIFGEEALYESAMKCKKGVMRKYSVQAFMLNIVKNIVMLSRAVRDGTYQEGPTRIVTIKYPKPRIALSIGIRDRVVQRSINDKALYPQMSRSFIYANYACQEGKGTSAALDWMKRMLHNAYLNYGTNDFYILSCDVEHYYDTMVHAIIDELFRKRLDDITYYWVTRILNKQYKGERGYNPGSQMVQIAGISYLDPLDHYIKEQLRRKYYIRYMDDFHIIGLTLEELEFVRAEIEKQLAKVGMNLHPKKTAIHRAKDGILFLGFIFKVTETGKVLMFRNPEKVKEAKRKMKRLTAKIISDPSYSEDDLDLSYQSIRACMEKGNSKRLLRDFDHFYRGLKKEIKDARNRAKDTIARRPEDSGGTGSTCSGPGDGCAA